MPEVLRRVKQETEDAESSGEFTRSTENQETRGEMSESPSQRSSSTVWFDVTWW